MTWLAATPKAKKHYCIEMSSTTLTVKLSRLVLSQKTSTCSQRGLPVYLVIGESDQHMQLEDYTDEQMGGYRPHHFLHQFKSLACGLFVLTLKSTVRYCEVFPHFGQRIPVLLRTLATVNMPPHLLHFRSQPFSAAVMEMLSWQLLLIVQPAHRGRQSQSQSSSSCRHGKPNFPRLTQTQHRWSS
jgi:hypothetical protein